MLTYIGAVVCVLLSGSAWSVALETCNGPAHWPAYLEGEKRCPPPAATFIHQPHTVWGVADRAWLTVPPEIQVRNSTIPGAGLGTYATTFIETGAWLGEYEGEIFTAEEGDITTAYSWVLHRAGSLSHYCDGARMETSNWLRWVNCPRTPSEENVKGVNCYGKMLYVTTKPIVRGEELMVYYGHSYARTLGIDPVPFGDVVGQGQCGCSC